MKQRSKALLVILSAAAMITAATFGTLAYFTDKETVTNTFTVGKVDITLDEAKLNDDGTVGPTRWSDGNEYNLVPGQTYPKDPMVTVLEKSEECYVFVTVDNQLKDIEAADGDNGYKSIETQMDENWDKLTGVTYNGMQVWTYKDKIAKSDSKTELDKVFTEFKIDGAKVVNGTPAAGEIDINAYGTSKIIVTAYAVQTVGFTDAKAAWEGTFGAPTTP